MSGHTHDHGHDAAASSRRRGKLIVVFAITLTVMIAEIIGSVLTGSLALLADAGHMFTDSAGLLIALIAASLALEAAAQQGKYEQMYAKMFETQPQWGGKQDSQAPLFRTYAQDLGLDLEKYDAAVADAKTKEGIRKDIADGTALGVTGTPTFFLDGENSPSTPPGNSGGCSPRPSGSPRAPGVLSWSKCSTMAGMKSMTRPKCSSPRCRTP